MHNTRVIDDDEDIWVYDEAVVAKAPKPNAKGKAKSKKGAGE